MITFSKYPDVCQYDDGKLEQMTLDDLRSAFEISEIVLSPADYNEWQNVMWNAITRVRSGLPKPRLQAIVDDLDQRKLALIRKYYESYDESVLQEHNEVELDIRNLSGQHELTRNTLRNLLRGLKIRGKNDN